ncbi:hypothetical protein C4572_01980 [Candidatus Parcubacteria bacterium]|nr:MAG: hypothetical protein C4572_01980 [Candidatus Parcubacteria bacterium]
MKRFNKTATFSLKIIVMAIFLVIGFEIYLNAVKYNSRVLLQFRQDIGWSQFANKKFYYKENLFKINNDGFRDYEHRLKKSSNLKRIAFVGSHYLRGTNSKFENIATSLLEKEWNKNNPNKKIEVFNFTADGYNLAMADFVIDKYSRKYDIDDFIYVVDPQKDPPVISGETYALNGNLNIYKNNKNFLKWWHIHII